MERSLFGITLKLSLFSFLDGTDFSEVNSYYCKSSYRTERGLTNATLMCREDVNCAMISSFECGNGESEYRLCGNSTELIPKLETCTLWKKGNIINVQSFNIISQIFKIPFLLICLKHGFFM